jgi:hypothetical protein
LTTQNPACTFAPRGHARGPCTGSTTFESLLKHPLLGQRGKCTCDLFLSTVAEAETLPKSHSVTMEGLREVLTPPPPDPQEDAAPPAPWSYAPLSDDQVRWYWNKQPYSLKGPSPRHIDSSHARSLAILEFMFSLGTLFYQSDVCVQFL